MTARTLVCRTLFLLVLIAGVGCAGYVFAAEAETWGVVTIAADPPAEAQKPEKPKTAVADIPRELAMKPLPTYRIEPPDVLQIDMPKMVLPRLITSKYSMFCKFALWAHWWISPSIISIWSKWGESSTLALLTGMCT